MALAGHNYAVVDGGSWYNLSGTSASAPVLAGLVAIANAQRARAGLPALGLLAPRLYEIATVEERRRAQATATGAVFNDVTEGDNHCTANSSVCCGEGFNATVGWDPLTGLGSFNFTRLVHALAKSV